MANIDSLVKIVTKEMDEVEKMLSISISSEIEILVDICRHILSSGGKRLRPLILLLATRISGYSGTANIELACVVEYLHTATLLHDDVIDHAELRRGSSAANILWGNQATILAGDFFFSKAFSMAVETGSLRALHVIAKASKCMAEAETFQVAKAGDPLISEDDYFFIIKNKTASLISASTEIGGILGEIPENQITALDNYGLNLGISFQIMDDVLDYCSNEKVFGKTIGKDFQEGSITLPFIAALNRSNPDDRQQMLKIAKDNNRGQKELSEIVSLIDKYEGRDYAVKKAEACSEKAIEALNAFRDDEKKQPLIDLARYVVTRQS